MWILLRRTYGFLRKLRKKHLKSIQATLDRLQVTKLTAKPSKCKIGHNIQDQTLRPKDDNLQAIKEAQGNKSKVVWV